MNNQNSINRWVDINKLETVILQEAVLDVCYQTLAGMIHNQTVRKECQRFEQHARYHQEEMRRIFPLSQESEIAIENKLYEYLLQLSAPYLFLKAVLNVGVNLTESKIEIYRYFSIKDKQHRILLNKFIDESKEDLIFLCRERNYHLNKVEDRQLKVLLN